MLDEQQQKALDLALKEPIIIINGQAGTGKSYTILQIEKALTDDGWMVNKMAFTGKAALRINGTTIHTWLEPNIYENEWGDLKHGTPKFKKMQFDTKECIIVDESSMLDYSLQSEISRVMQNTNHDQWKIIYVGDTGQLEPIGEGRPFLNFIENKTFPAITLSKIHRTKDGNDVVDFANHIRNNIPKPTLKNINDFFNSKVYNNIKIINIYEGINDILKDIINSQVICFSNKNEFGTKWFNLFIQKELKLTEPLMNVKEWVDKKLVKSGTIIYKGDRVVILENRYDFEVVNGLIGIAKGKKMFSYKKQDADGRVFNTMKECLVIETEDKEYVVPISWLEKAKIDLAYAISGHKSQGSEFKKVYIPLLDRNILTMISFGNLSKWLYTAITRTKDTCFIMNDERTPIQVKEDKEHYAQYENMEDDFDWDFEV